MNFPSISRPLQRAGHLFALVTFVSLAACGDSSDSAVSADSGESSVASLKLIGAASLPTGTLFQGVEFGGISGLDLAKDGTFWAMSDDRGGERGTPRFYSLAIDYGATGPVTVTIKSQTYLHSTCP